VARYPTDEGRSGGAFGFAWLNKLAVVICAHHKSWLMMSTLITAALQDSDDADLFVVLNKGDGERNFAGY